MGRGIPHWRLSSMKHDPKQANQIGVKEFKPIEGRNSKMLTKYHLPEDSRKKLEGFADPDCWQCHGSGVQGWKEGGISAVVCRCVKRELERREKVYGEAQKQIMTVLLTEAAASVVALRAEGKTAPRRPCMSCQDRVNPNQPDEKLVAKLKEGEICPACANIHSIPLTDDEWARLIAWERSKGTAEKLQKVLEDKYKKPAEIAQEVLVEVRNERAAGVEDRPEAVPAAPAGQGEAEGK